MPADNGPHKYKIANKLDPRVDSSSQQDTSITSGLGDARNYGKGGPHKSGTANKLDPREDLDQNKSAHDEVSTGKSYTNVKAGHKAGLHGSNTANE